LTELDRLCRDENSCHLGSIPTIWAGIPQQAGKIPDV